MAVPGPPTGSSYGPSRLPTCTQTVWNVAVGDPGSTHSSGNDIGNLLIMPTNVAETAIGVVVLFLDQRLNCVDMIWNKKILINYYVMQNMLML
jgi:hypothetical protein